MISFSGVNFAVNGTPFRVSGAGHGLNTARTQTAAKVYAVENNDTIGGKNELGYDEIRRKFRAARLWIFSTLRRRKFRQSRLPDVAITPTV